MIPVRTQLPAARAEAVMDRRAFLGTLGLLVAPLAAGAQPAGTVHHVGVLGLLAENPNIVAFRQGLQDLGYSEGRNIRLTYRTGDWREPPSPNLDRLAAWANELVRLKVDVIVAGPRSTQAAKATTQTTPIVGYMNDPVETGLVASLAKPGGNLTGVTIVGAAFTGKQLQLLKEMVPRAKRLAILSSADSANREKDFRDSQAAADKMGIRLQFLEARTVEDIDRLLAMATATETRVDGIHVYGWGFLYQHRQRILAYAKTGRLPAMYYYPSIVREGGLMAFGVDETAQWRRMAWQVDKILKGTRPADIPIEEPTKYILAVNVRTARELRLTIPPSLLARANEVIE